MSKIKVHTKTSLSSDLAISDLLAKAESKIGSISESPKLDSQLLLSKLLKRPREWLIAHGECELDSESISNFELLLEKRLSGYPIAYILGTRSFWRRDFHVSPHVLVPRPETELLVETLLARLAPQEQRIVDLGTGSGAIAISIAAERPAWIVTGIDRSPDAIAVARRNSKELSNIELKAGNWCDGIVSQSVDAIVSNPPYLRNDDPHLVKLKYEPKDALVAGAEGLEAIEKIVPNAYGCLKHGGLLLIEHGYNQQDSVMEIYRRARFKCVSGIRDLNNLPRCVLGYRL